MPAKKNGKPEPTFERAAEMGHKVLLAYIGAFGVLGDELGVLFERFVKRGERMEKDLRKLVREGQKEQRAAFARAEKTAKRAAKKIEITA